MFSHDPNWTSDAIDSDPIAWFLMFVLWLLLVFLGVCVCVCVCVCECVCVSVLQPQRN